MFNFFIYFYTCTRTTHRGLNESDVKVVKAGMVCVLIPALLLLTYGRTYERTHYCAPNEQNRCESHKQQDSDLINIPTTPSQLVVCVCVCACARVCLNGYTYLYIYIYIKLYDEQKVLKKYGVREYSVLVVRVL